MPQRLDVPTALRSAADRDHPAGSCVDRIARGRLCGCDHYNRGVHSLTASIRLVPGGG